MKKIIDKIRKNKLLTVLIVIIFVSVVFGTLFPAFLVEDNKILIHDSIEDFMISISDKKINCLAAFISSITNNFIVTIFLWVLGISIIGIPLILFVVFFKGFLVGFSFSSIILTYGVRGILKAIIYTIPNIINLFSSFLLSYYALTFSIMIYRCVFRKKDIHWQPIVKRYLKIGVFFLGVAIFVSILESYLIPKLLFYF